MQKNYEGKEINSLVEDTLNSIDKVNNCIPDEQLYERILNEVNQKDVSFIKDNTFGKYAIAFAILILINVFSFFNYHNNTDNKTTGDATNYSKSVNEFAKEYFSGQSEYSYNRK